MSSFLRIQPLLLVLGGLLLGSTGCVSRRLTVISNPPGALVEVDGQRLGVTPASMDFTYYGTREITLSKPGYETLTVQQRTPTPWYQVPPLDFISDNMLFGHVTDAHVFQYQLQPLRPEADNEFSLTDRARNFRSRAQVTR